MGVFTSACVNVQTCIKARIFSRWCLSLFLSGVCVCVCVCYVRQGRLGILLYHSALFPWNKVSH